jgi:hypothetical protein
VLLVLLALVRILNRHVMSHHHAVVICTAAAAAAATATATTAAATAITAAATATAAAAVAVKSPACSDSSHKARRRLRHVVAKLTRSAGGAQAHHVEAARWPGGRRRVM